MQLQLREWRPRSIVVGIVALGSMMLGAVPPSCGDRIPGRPTNSDCYIEELVTGAEVGAKVVPCTDGSDACDTDGLPNDVCVFKVALCPNQTDPNVPACTPHPPLTKITVKSMPKGTRLALPPDLSGTACGPVTDVIVPLKITKNGEKRPGKLKLIVTARSSGRLKKDRDKLVLVCDPPCQTCAGCVSPNFAGGPGELDLRMDDTGSDFDVGWRGTSHNLLFPRASLRLCLSGCDGGTNPLCDVTGSTGALNGNTFGPPLPLIAQGVPVCVVNPYQPGDLTAKFNVQTGEIADTAPLAVNLFSKVHLTSPSQVCPRCEGSGAPALGAQGICESGANQGQTCTIDSILTVAQAQGSPVYPLSERCVPDPRQLAGTLDTRFRLTTGTSTLQGPTPCPGQAQDDDCQGTSCDATCTAAACVSHTTDGQCIDAKGGISQVWPRSKDGRPRRAVWRPRSRRGCRWRRRSVMSARARGAASPCGAGCTRSP